MMIVIPKTIPEYLDMRFRRYNGPPKSIMFHDLERDAYYELKNRVKLTKPQFRDALREELDRLVSTGFLEKEGLLYTGDHFRHDKKGEN